MVAVGGEPLRRRAVQDMGPGGREGYGVLVVVNPARISLGTRRLRQAPSGGDVRGSQEVPHYADGGVLGRWASTTLEPALRSATGSGAEDRVGWGMPGTLGSALASASVVRALERASVRAPPARANRRHPTTSRKLTPGEPRLGSRAGGDRVKELRQVRIRQAVLLRTEEGHTGATKAAADLLVSHGWSSHTLASRSSQVKKWLVFCDEED